MYFFRSSIHAWFCCLVVFLLFPACQSTLKPRAELPAQTFGAVVFRELCQRIAYEESLTLRQNGFVSLFDVSGMSYRPVCMGEDAGPILSQIPPRLQTWIKLRQDFVDAVNQTVPKDKLDALDAYLRTLKPLQDDGTLPFILQKSAQILNQLSQDQAFLSALVHLDKGLSVLPQTQTPALLSALLSPSAITALINQSVPQFLEGGISHDEFLDFLKSLAFEMRHVSASDSTKIHPAQTLTELLLLRDQRLSQQMPFQIQVRNFKDLNIKNTVDLDGSLLMAALNQASLLFTKTRTWDASNPNPVDIPMSLMPVLALLSGEQNNQLKKTIDKETITYQGYLSERSLLADAAQLGVSMLQYQRTNNQGQDLTLLLQAVQNLVDDPNNESKLGRVLKALDTAAKEADKAIYSELKMPDKHTLFDDIAPILARIVEIPGLLDDVLAALEDPHTKNLGPMLATLMDERGYFYMNQDFDNNDEQLSDQCFYTAAGQRPGNCKSMVTGEFGHQVDRSKKDSDASNPWTTNQVDLKENNRSVLQRLLHLLSDANGKKPFCNGRNAIVFGKDLYFEKACDLFKIDNVARFFLLSIASQNIKERKDTFAQQSASFYASILNGNACQCLKTQPIQKEGITQCEESSEPNKRCNYLIKTIKDNATGDDFLSGLVGMTGFSRYPEPQAGARLLFIDVSRDRPNPNHNAKIQNIKGLIYHHTLNVATGDFAIDDHPDNRQFRDDNGQDVSALDKHNGVVFALEKLRPPARFADGSVNLRPQDNFYDAIRPLVDAFAKHSECFTRTENGTCTQGHNATQILVDTMAVLHKHWPTIESHVQNQNFEQVYGPFMGKTGLSSYELLLSRILSADLLLAMNDFVPVLRQLKTAHNQEALPLFLDTLRFITSPIAAAQAGIQYRNQKAQATRRDGQLAYQDATLAQVAKHSVAGTVTPLYQMLDIYYKSSDLLNQDKNKNTRLRAKQSIEDTYHLFLNVEESQGVYRFENKTLKPMLSLLLDFIKSQIEKRASEIPQLRKDLLNNIITLNESPIYASILKLALKSDQDSTGKAFLYDYLYHLLETTENTNNKVTLQALATGAIDLLQIVQSEQDWMSIAQAITPFFDPAQALISPVLKVALHGFTLTEEDIPDSHLLLHLMQNMVQQDKQKDKNALQKISGFIYEDQRKNKTTTGIYTNADYQFLIKNTADLLADENKGLARFIEIVKSRQ